jgi:hypothetical protein
LPSIGHDISRPSSSGTTASYTQQRRVSIQLPALSTLASVAAKSPRETGDDNDNSGREKLEGKMPSPPRYVECLLLWRIEESEGWKASSPEHSRVNAFYPAGRCSRLYHHASPRVKGAVLVWSGTRGLATLAYRSLPNRPSALFASSLTTKMDRPGNGISMTYATSAPATASGQLGAPVRFFAVYVVAPVESRARSKFLSLSNR